MGWWPPAMTTAQLVAEGIHVETVGRDDEEEVVKLIGFLRRLLQWRFRLVVASWCGRGGSRGGREGLGGADCKMRCRRWKEESGGRSDNKRDDRTKETLQIPFTVWEYNRLYKSLYLSLLVTMISTSKEHGFQYVYESRWSVRSRMVVSVVCGGVHVALLLDAGGGECASWRVNGSFLR